MREAGGDESSSYKRVGSRGVLMRGGGFFQEFRHTSLTPLTDKPQHGIEIIAAAQSKVKP